MAVNTIIILETEMDDGLGLLLLPCIDLEEFPSVVVSLVLEAWVVTDSVVVAV